MSTRLNSRHRGETVRRRLTVAVALGLLAAVVTTATAQLADEGTASWLTDNESRVIAAEIGLFGILMTEALAAVAIRLFERAGSLQTGIGVRAVLRFAGYMTVLVAVVSTLAANPALAIGLGGLTGVVVAFSAQNLVANAFAGVFLAIAQPFRIGEEITVMGLTGTVRDIRAMHTRIDVGDRIALIPSNAMMTQAIQRRPRRTRMDWESEDGLDADGGAEAE